jgi:hypothetical protein
MEQTYSLMAILRQDPDFAGALAKKTEAVKKDKQNLITAAQTYTQKYEKEINEGTKLRQKLITDGKEMGLTEDEALGQYGSQVGKFLPSVYTPILNWLFFTFREEAEAPQTAKMELEELTQYYINKFGYDGFIKRLEAGSEYTREVYSNELEDLLSDDTEQPVEMDSFIYGEMTNGTFQKIKKLKALAQSPNEREAFLAYRKCLELCKKHKLEFDKVPCNLKH